MLSDDALEEIQGETQNIVDGPLLDIKNHLYHAVISENPTDVRYSLKCAQQSAKVLIKELEQLIKDLSTP